MHIVTDSKVSVSCIVGGIKSHGLMLSVAVKGNFLMKNDGPTVSLPEPPNGSGDVYSEGEVGKTELLYPSDFIPFKPRADVLMVGVAHVPGGRPVSQLQVGMRVGRLNKALSILGDRLWHRWLLLGTRASDPTLLTSMPLRYERAYGGINFKPNPIGLGYDKKRLPNVESPIHAIHSPSDRPFPAGFGPIAPDWEPRCSKVGTYAGDWLKCRWPWFPADFDWSYFNSAPEDQQVEGYLRGDEELEFQNLHPSHPLYRSGLPGLRARAFVQRELPDAEPEFSEVPLNLDTLWIDMETETLVLVWRGLTPARSVKFKEVTHIAALTEPLSSPVLSKEEMREWMLQRIREERGEGPPTPEEAAEEAAAKASRVAFEKDMAAMDKEKSELENELSAADEKVMKQVEQQKQQLVALGIDPGIFDQPAKPQTWAEMKAQRAAQISRLAETNPEAAASFAGMEKELDEVGKMDQEFAALEAEELPPMNRESVAAAAAQGKPLPGADLSGLDLSTLDLSGANLSDANFSGTNLTNTKLTESRLTGADFTEANLSGADMSHADLDGANFSDAKLEGAKFPGASVQGASLSELQLAGADFSGCSGKHPNFSGSNLEGANFSGAKLPQADFCGANIKAAKFIQAELASADFGGAFATEINMEKADLTNLRAGEKANFSGGNFREANASKSIWEGAVLDRADFSRAVLTGALFEDASVKETNFDRANLTKASFENASVYRARLTNANLLRASFNRANLTEARLDGSNLYEASFWETVLHQTNIEGANVKRTLIS